MKQNVKGYDGFLKLLKSDIEVYDKFIAYLTINVSEFYRNPSQWKTLEEVILPGLAERFGNDLKIWSAACSTGEECYSLAMVMKEVLPSARFEILATDLDKEVLQKAQKGYYSERNLKGLPDRYRKKYIQDDGSGVVKVSDRLKSNIVFKQHNLLKDSYPQGMHLIVCRNVMIYFTEEAKSDIYHKFASSLHEKGILFVGSTEQIIGASTYGFKGVQSFFYEKQ
jgi:chemotaxis protein methyltransferase CheR